MRRALEELGAEVVPLGRSDSFVPIDTEAVPREAAARIRAWVEEHRLAALVSTDGDGDRPLLADETGAVLRGDTIGALAAHVLGADAIATPLNASTAVERSGWFAHVIRTRIGSPHVIEAMAALAQAGARLPVGYEANGGFLLGGTAVSREGRRLEPLATRDAMVPILALLAAMARETRPLSALVADLPARATASDRLAEVDVAACAQLLQALAAGADARTALLGAVSATDTLDGVRMTLAIGRDGAPQALGQRPRAALLCRGRRCRARRSTARQRAA